jgi:hypothetical protein
MTEQSESVSKLFAALVAAQAEMRNPPKDSVNPHFKSRFADLATVLDTVKPVLAKWKLGVVQLPCEVKDVGPGLATMLVHETGEWVRGVIGLRPAKQDPQGIGAALTYARRYGLQAVLGITADDDDDGHHASRPAQQRQQAAPPKAARPTRDEMAKLLQTRGWDWGKVIGAINQNHGTTYTVNTKLDEVLTDHIADFAGWLRAQPEVQAA